MRICLWCFLYVWFRAGGPSPPTIPTHIHTHGAGVIWFSHTLNGVLFVAEPLRLEGRRSFEGAEGEMMSIHLQHMNEVKRGQWMSPSLLSQIFCIPLSLSLCTVHVCVSVCMWIYPDNELPLLFCVCSGCQICVCERTFLTHVRHENSWQWAVFICQSLHFLAEEIYCSRSCEWDGSGPPPRKPLRRAGGVQCLKSCFQRWRLNERASVPQAPHPNSNEIENWIQSSILRVQVPTKVMGGFSLTKLTQHVVW